MKSEIYPSSEPSRILESSSTISASSSVRRQASLYVSFVSASEYLTSHISQFAS
nr:MAG TPA: hypothetical protein [Caudoviricetes sp.]